MAIVRSFYGEYGRLLQGAAMRDGEEIEKALRLSGDLNRVLDRAWPAVTPEKLVRALFTTPAFLAEAADGILDEDEQRLLRRRATGVERRATCRCSTRRTRSSASRRARTTT